MIKYRYRIDENTTTETVNVKDIPKGTPYETINEILVDENPNVIEPTKDDLIQTVQELQQKIIEVEQQVNNLL